MYFQHLSYGVFIFLLNAFFIAFGMISPIGLVNLFVVSVPHLRDAIFVIIQIIFKPCVSIDTRKDEECKEMRNILCVIPTYKENIKEISATLDSFIQQEGNDFVQKRLLMICDGYFKYEAMFSSMDLIATVKYDTFLEKYNYAAIYNCRYQSSDVLVVLKTDNAGKKDSWILIHNIFMNDEFLDVRNTLLNNMNLASINYIFNTDGDSVISSNTLMRLSRIMVYNQDISAVSGLVLTPVKFRFWYLFQGFQYFYGQLIRRMAESYWGKTSCIPGCINMINIKHRCVIESLNYFKQLPDKELLFQIKNRLQGTDRRFTNCLLQHSKNVRLVTDRKSHCYTVPPQSLKHFQSQRKRWMSNVVTGNYYLLTGKNIPWYTRVLSLVDLFRIHTCIARLFSSIMLWIMVRDLNIWQIFGMSCMFAIPYLYFLFHAFKIHGYRLFLVTGSLVSKLSSPFITVYVFIYSVYHFSDSSWGKTHGEKPDENTRLLKTNNNNPTDIIV